VLSSETSAGTIWGSQRKHAGRLLFCLGNSEPLIEDMFDFTTHAGFSFCFFTIEACFYLFLLKKMGEKIQNFIFSFDSFSDIACFFCLRSQFIVH